MNRISHFPTATEVPQFNFLKTGLIAVLVALGFSLLPSFHGPGGTSEVNTIADEKNTATTTSPSDFPNIKIKNFGQMDEHFYRGAQPKPDDYGALSKLGTKTIVDLRDDPTSYEKPKAEAAHSIT